MSFPAGWYDDPKDPTQQRYWDGGFWTDYRRPREGPPPYQGKFGEPEAYQPGFSGQPGFGPGLGQPGMGREGYGPQGQQGFGYPGQGGPATPDGQPLAGWWKRVLARIIDAIIVFFVTLPATGYFFYRYAEAALDYQRAALDRGDSPFVMTLPPEVLKWLTPATLILLVLYAFYDYFFLTRSGATPGKKAVGISVRLSTVPGPPCGPRSTEALRFLPRPWSARCGSVGRDAVRVHQPDRHPLAALGRQEAVTARQGRRDQCRGRPAAAQTARLSPACPDSDQLSH